MHGMFEAEFRFTDGLLIEQTGIFQCQLHGYRVSITRTHGQICVFLGLSTLYVGIFQNSATDWMETPESRVLPRRLRDRG